MYVSHSLIDRSLGFFRLLDPSCASVFPRFPGERTCERSRNPCRENVTWPARSIETTEISERSVPWKYCCYCSEDPRESREFVEESVEKLASETRSAAGQPTTTTTTTTLDRSSTCETKISNQIVLRRIEEYTIAKQDLKRITHAPNLSFIFALASRCNVLYYSNEIDPTYAPHLFHTEGREHRKENASRQTVKNKNDKMKRSNPRTRDLRLVCRM